ncbi:glycosyltransferase family 2 protein [Aequorivita lipolytica]|uniref:Glycosyltransferase family 2 protein n=1 Tax=Aequorivita lipolytica TaxID=153267 RepID=A0A5C6YN17_9FLAO|nr:glycosyltransferase family 2 protein [Aequorivita lipolytica]TXD68600.1 glycosyltransferase family 2 protein [Aequorivita lipolytica]SRX53248.1 Putative glycosyltransferase EpsE [Aequorivita lipolytica]
MENNAPLVSVLMTVYNREKYVAQAIESVIKSTFKNWELIIVDDGSNDASVKIARQYEAQDNRIKVYINENNLGDYPNRNKAASYAKGKYLKYVDSDDLMYPNGLEEMVYYMEQFPEAGYGLCLDIQDEDQIYPFQLSPPEAYKYHYFDLKSIFHKAPMSSIINRKSFEAIHGFSGKQHVGDVEIWHKLSQRFPVVLMPGALIWSREHDDQQMNDNMTNPFIPFKYILITEALILSKNCPLNEDEKKIILNKLQNEKAVSIISAIKHHSLKKGLELQKESGLSWNNVLYRKLMLPA